MKCACIIVSGKVQGVFFRDNMRKKSAELGLSGYAKNLINGKVEVVAQGSEPALKELIGYIWQSPGASKVENVVVEYRETENFMGFEIRS